jgi:hypothetical protein
MTESAKTNRSTPVKPRSTWVITSKTSPMNPNEPLDQVYTHPWWTRGQRHGQTRLNVDVGECRPELLPRSPKFA